MNPTRSVLSDQELIKAVRNGEISAFAGLYVRHVVAAGRLARLLTPDADDADRLVSDAFARVRMALMAGAGPTIIFRTYVLSEIRGPQSGNQESESTEPVVGVQDATSLPVPVGSLVAHALVRLPARWQLVLWHLEVEREPPATVGPILGLTPGEVSKLGDRALDRLRAAYLREMEDRAFTEECSWAAQRLGAGVSHHQFDPERQRLDHHIATCERCQQLFVEFGQLEHRPGFVLGPLVLGDLAAEYSMAGRPVAESPTAAGRRSGHGHRIALVSTAVAAVAGIVVLAATQLPSAAPAPATRPDAPQSVAHTSQSPVQAADVAVSLTGSLVRGRRTQLRVQIANRGPTASGALTLAITLPAGATLLGPPAGGWQCTGRTTTLVCSHRSLASGGTVTGAVEVSVGLTAPLGGRATAEVRPSTKDPSNGNNRSRTAGGVTAG